MTYKEFIEWCSDRCFDGCWSSKTAMYCLQIRDIINGEHFWKREKLWKKEYEQMIVTNIVNVIDKKRNEINK